MQKLLVILNIWDIFGELLYEKQLYKWCFASSYDQGFDSEVERATDVENDAKLWTAVTSARLPSRLERLRYFYVFYILSFVETVLELNLN